MGNGVCEGLCGSCEDVAGQESEEAGHLAGSDLGFGEGWDCIFGACGARGPGGWAEATRGVVDSVLEQDGGYIISAYYSV